jgi:cobaltochelatase CobT
MPGPFPDRLVEAVGACTRALAGEPVRSLGEGGDADAMLGRANAATIGALRAFGDRLALRRRFHSGSIHRQHRPASPEAGLFDALELARIDALGARWLEGVAKNLLAHPGADADGLRWLAFEIFSGRGAPPEKTPLVRHVRGGLPTALVAELTRSSSTIEDQSAFAAFAAAWARKAFPHMPPEPASRDATPFLLGTREVVRTLPKRGDPGGTSAPLKKGDAQPASSENAPGGGAAVQSSGARIDGYQAYTMAFDRVVNAASLASRAELATLHEKLGSELSALQPVVARLAKRLMRVLMARQTREWRFDLDEGVLDASRLAAFVASRGAARPFKQESESPFPSTVVSLLIDHSGSMRGRPMLIAALTVEIFARVLERCGVKCEVLGFTTRDWDGGEPARQWAADGYPEQPGRLNALEHIVIKSADVPWRRARVALGLFLHDEMLKENIDGEAVAWAHARLRARSEQRRILVVVSDGTPMDEATMAANGHEYLESHLQEVVEEIETRSSVQLAAIGIGHDVSTFYRNATTIARVEQLGPALSTKLIALLGEQPRVTRGGRL